MERKIVKLLAEKEFTLLAPIAYKTNNTPIEVQCSKGHIFKTSYKKLTRYGCNQCSNHFKSSEAIETELINNKIKLLDAYENSHALNKFQCLVCNNIFTGAYYSVLSRKTPCKECRRRKVSPRRIDLDEILLSLAAEGYTYIGGEYHNNRSRLDVICPNKHIITIAHISWKQKSRCPICARARQGKIKYDEMFIKNFLSDNGLTLLEKDKQTITVKCSEGHITKRKWFETFKHKRFCRICKINKPEREILSFLKELGVKKQHRVRGIIGKKEIDFYLPEYNLGIEFNGLFWHSDYVLKDKNYHKNKQNMCENRGINLITIWQNEWENKKEIVKSIIKSRLGISDTVLDGGYVDGTQFLV